MIDSFFGDRGPVAAQCSRAKCGLAATQSLQWRNPRIHTDGRSKTWLACDEHTSVLVAFLTDRGFPVSVSPFEPASIAAADEVGS